MGVHMPTLRDADRGIESGGSLPSASVPPRAAQPTDSDVRNSKRPQRIGEPRVCTFSRAPGVAVVALQTTAELAEPGHVHR